MKNTNYNNDWALFSRHRNKIFQKFGNKKCQLTLLSVVSKWRAIVTKVPSPTF